MLSCGNLKDISIHAPQWGATSGLRGRGGFVEISIHAPQWGATHRQHPNQRHPQHFNPRTPVGCDITRYSTFANMPHVAHRLQHVISIHAPQWGATSRNSIIPTMHQHFNPRTPVGCDRIGWSATYQGVVTFQSTHPSGVRRHDSVISSFHLYFNPRTPVGCDTTGIPSGALKSGFQSTHPSGVRLRP